MQDSRPRSLMIRLTTSERAALDALKERTGLSRSDVVRLLLKKEVVYPSIGHHRVDPRVRAMITNWPSRFRLEGTPEESAWSDVFSRFADPGPLLATRYQPGWSPCVFSPCRRSPSALCEVSALVFECTCTGKAQALDLVCEVFGVAYQGFAHTVEGRRHVRVILPLLRSATAKEHARLVAWASRIARAKGLTLTPESRDATRFWTVPGLAPGAFYDSRVFDGERRVDPDRTGRGVKKGARRGE